MWVSAITRNARNYRNKRLGKLDKQYGAIRLSYNVTFTYEGTGKNEVATSMTWKCREDKTVQTRKFHGKYVLLTSLDGKPGIEHLEILQCNQNRGGDLPCVEDRP